MADVGVHTKHYLSSLVEHFTESVIRDVKDKMRTLARRLFVVPLETMMNATLHDSIGTPLGTVQALLGHSSSEITRQVYLHSLSADRRVAVEKLEALNYWTQIGPKLWVSIGAAMIC